jgi:hypothetical protein
MRTKRLNTILIIFILKPNIFDGGCIRENKYDLKMKTIGQYEKRRKK